MNGCGGWKAMNCHQRVGEVETVFYVPGWHASDSTSASLRTGTKMSMATHSDGHDTQFNRHNAACGPVVRKYSCVEMEILIFGAIGRTTLHTPSIRGRLFPLAGFT